MRERLIVLRERRTRLLERASAERERLARVVQATGIAEPWLEAGERLVAQARRHPGWVLAAVAVVVALKPRRAIAYAVKGWSLYQLYRRGRALWERVGPLVAGAARGA